MNTAIASAITTAAPVINSQGVKLYQNSPNPFLEMTLLWFALPGATQVVLKVINEQGREVCSKSGYFSAGESNFVIHRADLRDSGFYTARIETIFGTASRKMMMY